MFPFMEALLCLQIAESRASLPLTSVATRDALGPFPAAHTLGAQPKAVTIFLRF